MEKKKKVDVVVKSEDKLYEQRLYNERKGKVQFLEDRPVASLTIDQKDKLARTLKAAWGDMPLLDSRFEEMYISCSTLMKMVFEQLEMAGEGDKAVRSRYWDCITREIRMWYKDKINKVLKNYTIAVNIRKLDKCLVLLSFLIK